MHFQHPFSSPKMYGLHQAPHIEHSYISATNVCGSGHKVVEDHSDQ